jgi:hypothetical protein
VVEQESHGVRENFSKQPAGEVPEVAYPHPLYAVTPGELAENGVDAVAKTAQQRAAFGSGISFLGSVGGHKLYAHRAQELFFGLGRVVIAIPDHDAVGTFDDLGQHRELVGVSRGYREVSDETGPRHPHMHPKTVEGLLEEGVLAESGLPPESTAVVGAGEEARWQGHRVADSEGWVVRSEGEKLLPEVLLDLEEIVALCRAKVVRWISRRRTGNHSP